MEANKFEPSKHQRQILNRFNNFIQEGDNNFEKDIVARQQEHAASENTALESAGAESAATIATESNTATTSSNDAAAVVVAEATESTSTATANITGSSGGGTEGKKQKQKPRKAPKNASADLKTRIRSSEYLRSPDITEWKHRLRIRLEPASFTKEKHALFMRYQMAIHHEPASKCQPKNFTNFLVTSPLTPSKDSEWTEEDPGFGSFHQCYYLDEKLIAVSVLDILPECISAVYFYYDPDYSVLSLGKYSAQREIAMVQTLNEHPGYEKLQYYYMGFYIFSCPKMTYKGHFYPSYLLDPVTCNWVEFKKCEELLKDKRYSAFEHPTAMNPLLEAKIQSIIDKKKGSSSKSDSDNSENDDDDWESMDEVDDDDDDEDDKDLDPDAFDDNAIDNSGDEAKTDSQGGGNRKKTKLDLESSESSTVKAAEERAHRRAMSEAFRQTTRLPPPGCLDPQDVAMSDLVAVLCLSGKNELRPVVVTDMYRNHPSVQKLVAEYYSYVGPVLAERMIVYVQ
ncbi:Arginyl-tRNA--protein transferase 1 [Dissophora globulifera]|nr:Arginyl-tRNA--protein transferase 1 [Dissophora globulifera]